MAAVTDAYGTHPDYTQRFSNAIDPKRKPAIDRALVSGSRWIEQHTGKFFHIDSSIVTRVFRGDGTGCLKLHGDPDNPLCPGIATAVGLIVKLDTNGDRTYATTLVIGTDFELAPPAALLGPQPGPYLELRTLTGGAHGVFADGQLVQIQAKFGYPSVPATIRDGCVELAGILLGDSPLATRQFTDIGTVGASTEARGIIRDMIDIHGPGIVVA